MVKQERKLKPKDEKVKTQIKVKCESAKPVSLKRKARNLKEEELPSLKKPKITKFELGKLKMESSSRESTPGLKVENVELCSLSKMPESPKAPKKEQKKLSPENMSKLFGRGSSSYQEMKAKRKKFCEKQLEKLKLQKHLPLCRESSGQKEQPLVKFERSSQSSRSQAKSSQKAASSSKSSIQKRQ